MVACMQAEQMMRDFDDIMIPLQLNLTSQGCINKDVMPLKVPNHHLPHPIANCKW
jgi:hypothetical protein